MTAEKILQILEGSIDGEIEMLFGEKNKYFYQKEFYLNVALVFSFVACCFVLVNSVYDSGLHYDEVNRLNPLFAIFFPDAEPNDQAIWSINFCGYKLPIMYKEYISSLSTFYMLPIIFFKNPVIGLKTMYIVYFFLEILCVFLYLKRFNKTFATCISILIMTNPLVYPDIAYGFSNCFHIIFLVLSLYQFEKYYKNKALKNLFGGVFYICLGANVSFYTIWNIVALMIASVIIDFAVWKNIVKSIAALFTILGGAFLGLFNFILYNLFCGFPTVKTLFKYIFATNDFKMDDISNESLSESIMVTLHKLDYMLNGHIKIYVMGILFIFIIWFFLFLLHIKKRIRIEPHLFYPILVVLFTIICILISPKPRFPYHWLRISPFWEILLLLSFVIIKKYFFNCSNLLSYSAVAFILLFNLYQSNCKLQKSLLAVSDYQLSNDYQLCTNYFIKNKVGKEQIIYLQWGIDAPIYFSSQGKISSDSPPYFKLLNLDEGKIREELSSIFSVLSQNDIYLPLFKNQGMELNQKTIFSSVINFLDTYSLEYSFIGDEWFDDLVLVKVTAASNYFELLNKPYLDKVVIKKLNNSLLPSFQGHVEGTSYQSDSFLYDIWGWCFIDGEQTEFMLPLDANGTVSGLITCNLPREDVYQAYGEPTSENAGFRGVCNGKTSIESIIIGTKEGNLYRWNLQTNP